MEGTLKMSYMSLGETVANLVFESSFIAARYRRAAQADYKFYNKAGQIVGYRFTFKEPYICINCGPDCQCEQILSEYEQAINDVIGLMVDKNLFELANEIENKFIKKED